MDLRLKVHRGFWPSDATELLRLCKAASSEVLVNRTPVAHQNGGETTRTRLNVALRPVAVNEPPHFPIRILVLQCGGSRCARTLSKHWSIAKRRSDAGMPTAVKTWMARCRKRPAVIHRGRDRHAGRHFVVQKASDPRPQQRREFRVKSIVGAARVGINAAGQIAFKFAKHLSASLHRARRLSTWRCQTLPSAIFPALPEIFPRSRAAACSQIGFPPGRRRR